MYVLIFSFYVKLIEQVHPKRLIPEKSSLPTNRNENHKYPKYWQDYWIRTDWQLTRTVNSLQIPTVALYFE
jgi:hypothetical protein